jgi:hypothetical protein
VPTEPVFSDCVAAQWELGLLLEGSEGLDERR